MSNKPEIVVMDVKGHHNQNLDQETTRIIEGATWKKCRVIIILPAGAMVPAKCALSWWNMAMAPNQACVKFLTQNMEVGVAYSESIEQILAHPDLSQFEYILTLEHDQVVPSDGLLRLIKRLDERPDISAVSGLYWTRNEGGCPQCWGDPKDPVVNFAPQPPPPAGECREYRGIGMGFALWRLSMFKDPKLRRPWFKTLTGLEGQGAGTQDLYFCSDAGKYGYRFAVDASVLVGHLDPATGLVW